MSMLKRLWAASPSLTATGFVMTGVLAGALVGLALDPRVITEAPAWLKPAKFAVSIAIYSWTLAWIFTLLPGWPRVRRAVGRTTMVVMLLEMAIIAGQAWRGTTSHFNVSTPVDQIMFMTMGAAILLQTLSTVAVAIALWRERFEDGALGAALRFGMIITIAGALTGGLMTRPTPEQLAAARTGHRMTVAGAHTVGAPDGGPGLPGTGWSTTHGDIRVAHFVGLHAVQALPLVAFGLRHRRVADAVRARVVTTAAASYATLFGILLVQALRGQSVVAPDAATIAALAIWAVATSLSVIRAASPGRRAHAPVIV